jgi:hypothetical protein
VCHAVLHDRAFFLLLLHIDQELAASARAAGCRCGGPLHSARYPRKPRGCPASVREDFAWRFSFCCAHCARRTTPASVRFLGRRVYVAVMLMLLSPPGGASARLLSEQLGVPVRTLARWRHWWRHVFVTTPLWRSIRTRLVQPLPLTHLPHCLLQQFLAPDCTQQLLLMLRALCPLSHSPSIAR